MIMIKNICFFIAAVLGLFIGTSFSKKAREKYKILKKADGKKHIYCIVIVLLILIGYGLDYYRSLPKTIKTFNYSFTEFYTFKDHRKEKEFDSTPKALQKELNPDARCPCGSGKKYSDCHTPELIKDERNYWRGPKFLQNIYLGYKEKFNGIAIFQRV